MTDAAVALSLLRKLAASGGYWKVDDLDDDGALCCIETSWFDATPAEADLLLRLRAELDVAS